MSEAPERIHVRWGKAGDTRVTYMEERFRAPDTGAEYVRSDLCATRAETAEADLVAARAELATVTAERDALRTALSYMVNHAEWREENEGVFWEATNMARAALQSTPAQKEQSE